MHYIKILSTNHSDLLLFFYIETDENFFEKRKIEIANDGLLGYADENFSYRETTLDENPLLTLQEINQISGMQAWEINQSEFDHYWNAALNVITNN